VYVTGISLTQSPVHSLIIGKHRADGTPIWERRIAGPPGAYPTADLAVSPAGDVYLGVFVQCSPSDDCAIDLGGGPLHAGVVKLTSEGAFAWQRVLQFSSDLAAGPNGEVAFVEATFSDATLRVVDATGASKWSIPGGSNAMAFAPDGSLYVAQPDASGTQQLLHLDAAGRLLWVRGADFPITHLAASGRGSLAATGTEQLAAYEAPDGAQRFSVPVPLLFNTDLAVRPGIHDVVEAVVVGQSSTGCSQAQIRAYDLAGAFRWIRLIGPSEGCDGAPLVGGVTVLDSGDVVVAGSQVATTDLGEGARTPVGLADGFLLQLAGTP
jgi:hypothetical protein